MFSAGRRFISCKRFLKLRVCSFCSAASKDVHDFYDVTIVGGGIASKQALRMGYSEICFRIARGRASQESLQWSLYDLSIYVQILNVNC